MEAFMEWKRYLWGEEEPCDGIHGPPKPTVLFDQKSLEPTPNLMGTGVDKLQLQNSLSTRKQRRETRSVK